jgi:bis(5'-nucleosidyl)-tetraphosphatase
MYSVKELRASGFVIFRTVCNQVEYLLLQTSYGTHHWTPPKGKLQAMNDLELVHYRIKNSRWRRLELKD